jgi:plasmid stabilization system protein ParE
MRRIVYAESFVEDANRIVEYIETRFGTARADIFIADLNRFCGLVAQYPGIGRKNHGYGTTLHGVAHDRNWIFFEYDDSEIRFVHLIEGVRDKHIVQF